MNDFPILQRQFNGKKLVYLDNAATSQKPMQVINAVSDYYSNHNANVHRGIYALSEESTEMYEENRSKVSEFIGANRSEEVVFTKGTTASINGVARSWGMENLKMNDVILLTDAEHHSNLIPWQQVAKKTGARLKFLVTDDNGEISLDHVKTMIDAKVKLVAIPHSSNVLGTIFPVKEICKIAHSEGAKVLVDGAQAVPHLTVNMKSLGCDFYAFSSHKMLGPMGVGVLWAKEEILTEMEPFEFGGGMIDVVNETESSWDNIPSKFEAGTPDVAGVVGLGAAVDYLKSYGMDKVRKHEIMLNKYALEKLAGVTGLTILGPKEAEKRTGLISFTLEGVHSHDVAAILAGEGVAVRSGHHCAMPLHRKLNISASTRASFYIYNTKSDIDRLVEGVRKAQKVLG